MQKSVQDSLQKTTDLLTAVSQERLRRRHFDRLVDLSESMINSLPGVFYLYDESGKFLHWNHNFEAVTGYTAAEMECRHPLDFFRVISYLVEYVLLGAGAGNLPE